MGFGVEHVKTFGRWASDTVVRYLGEAHVSDPARSRRRFIREQGLLEGHELAAVANSGPGMCTPAEVERIVQRAVEQSVGSVSARVDELLPSLIAMVDIICSGVSDVFAGFEATAAQRHGLLSSNFDK